MSAVRGMFLPAESISVVLVKRGQTLQIHPKKRAAVRIICHESDAFCSVVRKRRGKRRGKRKL